MRDERVVVLVEQHLVALGGLGDREAVGLPLGQVPARGPEPGRAVEDDHADGATAGARGLDATVGVPAAAMPCSSWASRRSASRR